MPEEATEAGRGETRELAVRIASAVVLVAVTLAVTHSGVVPFAVLVTGVGLVLIWEWGRLVRGPVVDAQLCLAAVGVVVAIMLTAGQYPAIGVGVLVACTVGLTMWRPDTAGLVSALGVLYAGLPSVALVWLRSGPTHGLEAIVFVLLVVWTTDTGAFIAGRSLGGPRLWVAVSPKKTWSGLVGGIVAAAVIAWLFSYSIGSIDAARAAGLAAVLAITSQAGDLFESALKRAYGVKDSSGLIPGHGGFMDRVDGLVFAAIAAALFSLVVDHTAPAATLLGIK